MSEPRPTALLLSLRRHAANNDLGGGLYSVVADLWALAEFLVIYFVTLVLVVLVLMLMLMGHGIGKSDSEREHGGDQHFIVIPFLIFAFVFILLLSYYYYSYHDLLRRWVAGSVKIKSKQPNSSFIYSFFFFGGWKEDPPIISSTFDPRLESSKFSNFQNLLMLHRGTFSFISFHGPSRQTLPVILQFHCDETGT